VLILIGLILRNKLTYAVTAVFTIVLGGTLDEPEMLKIACSTINEN
jgi:hypothetical protein